MIIQTEEIGGYFGLDLPESGEAFTASIKFQSGRAALRAALECSGITRVMVPAYICDSVILAVVDAGATVDTYRLDDRLHPLCLFDPIPEKCALLYVNYFGLCTENVSRLLQEFPRNQLIIDNSQALFALPTNALATIYSPRKFVGVPDGGLLMTPAMQIKLPEEEDGGSIGRMRHLLLRMAYTAREGYLDYIESEKSLGNTRPLRMSRLTERILYSIDMTRVKHRRRENFSVLAACLDKHNAFKWELGTESVPLCYPLIINDDAQQIKRNLIAKGIYIPTYWSDAKSRVTDGVEYHLINSCLPLPCDQRYSPSQMTHLADEIILGLNNE
jgi:hypothetical protein